MCACLYRSAFLAQAQCRVTLLMSDEVSLHVDMHFTINGTMLLAVYSRDSPVLLL